MLRTASQRRSRADLPSLRPARARGAKLLKRPATNSWCGSKYVEPAGRPWNHVFAADHGHDADSPGPQDLDSYRGHFVSNPESARCRPDFSQLDDELSRSEERRVGKECRFRWSPYH